MKFLNGKYYVEVKDERYLFHPSENSILRLLNEPKSSKHKMKFEIILKLVKDQKVIKNEKSELKVNNYP